MFTALSIEPTYEHILNLLRQRIFFGIYYPGYELKLDILSDEFACSRTPIRDALQLLDGEGMVDYIPKKGIYVKKTSVGFLEDYFSTRTWMEARALERVCDWGMGREHLGRKMEKELAAYQKRDFAELADSCELVNQLFYGACKSAFLEQFLQKLCHSGPEFVFMGRKDEEYYHHALCLTVGYHKQITSALCEEKRKAIDGICSTHYKQLEENAILYREELEKKKLI